MKIIKNGFITGLFMVMTLTTAYGQSREERGAFLIDGHSVTNEKAENDLVKTDMKVCDIDKKEKTKNFIEERVLFRQKLNEFI